MQIFPFSVFCNFVQKHSFAFFAFLHFVSYLLYQLRFRLVKHLKMTVWNSVLWKENIQLAKKWPDMVVKWPFISCYFLRVNQAGVMPPSTSEAITFYQSRFRPIKQLKMTVWTSVLWKTNIKLVKKWSDIVVEWPFISCYFLKVSRACARPPSTSEAITFEPINILTC